MNGSALPPPHAVLPSDVLQAAIRRERALPPLAFLAEVRAHMAHYHPPRPSITSAASALSQAALYHMRSWLARLYAIGAEEPTAAGDAAALSATVHRVLAAHYGSSPSGPPLPSAPSLSTLTASASSSLTSVSNNTGSSSSFQASARELGAGLPPQRPRSLPMPTTVSAFGGDMHSLQLAKVAQMVWALGDGGGPAAGVVRGVGEPWAPPLPQPPAPRRSYRHRLL